MNNYLNHVIAGVGVTLWIALCSLLLAMLLGLAGAAGKLSSHKLLHVLAGIYSTLVRGVPELVWMLFLFFGAQIWLNRLCVWLEVEPVDIDPMMAGIVTIGFIFGAYMTETFRGAILAIPAGQKEAAQSLGMSSLQVFRRIIVPQMIPHALPSFSNNWMVLVKSTALVSVLGVSDLMHRAALAKSATGNAFGVYLTVSLVYLFITSASVWGLRRVEQRFSRGKREAA